MTIPAVVHSSVEVVWRPPTYVLPRGDPLRCRNKVVLEVSCDLAPYTGNSPSTGASKAKIGLIYFQAPWEQIYYTVVFLAPTSQSAEKFKFRSSLPMFP